MTAEISSERSVSGSVPPQRKKGAHRAGCAAQGRPGRALGRVQTRGDACRGLEQMGSAGLQGRRGWASSDPWRRLRRGAARGRAARVEGATAGATWWSRAGGAEAKHEQGAARLVLDFYRATKRPAQRGWHAKETKTSCTWTRSRDRGRLQVRLCLLCTCRRWRAGLGLYLSPDFAREKECGGWLASPTCQWEKDGEREGKEWGNDLRLGLELRGYGPKHVWVGVKYENELTVLVAEADGDDKHRNTGKHRNQDKTSFRAWFDRGERLENRKLDGTSYGVG